MTAWRNAGFGIDWESHSGDFTCHLGKAYIRENVNGDGSYQQTIVIEKQLEQLMVANAAALSNGLNINGRVVVNGILFDTGKAEVKPESGPALTEVVAMLKQKSALKLYVVGHTDNLGALAGNGRTLNRRRVEVVKQ